MEGKTTSKEEKIHPSNMTKNSGKNMAREWEAGGRTKNMGGDVGGRGIPRTDGDKIGWEVGRMHKMGRQFGELRDHRADGNEIGRKSGRTGPTEMKSGGDHIRWDDVGRETKRGQRMGGRWEK